MNFTHCLLLLPIVLPLLAAPLVYFLQRKNERTGHLLTSTVCLAALIAAALTLRLSPVELAVPDVFLLGLTFHADGFQSVFGILCTYLFFMSSLANPAYFRGTARIPRYCAFLLLTLGGIMGVFYAGDLFTLYIFFELMSIASWVWVGQTETPGAQRAADTYLAMAMIGGLTMLYGLFLLYHQLGTLSLAELPDLCAAADPHTLYVPAICLLVGFGIKAGMFPFHVWLPKAHPVAPAPASALLSGILTKSGIFGILVISTCILWGNVPFTLLLLGLGVVTMVLGAVLAIFSVDLKRTLACSSLSQIGFLLVGAASLTMGAETDLAAAGIMSHAVNHALTKLVLFVTAGVLYKNTHTLDLNELQGAGRKCWPLAIPFAIGGLSIAGVPGFGGYISKTLLHESLVHQMHHQVGAMFTAGKVAESLFLFSGGLTLAYMTKLFVKIFVEKPTKAHTVRPDKGSLTAILPTALVLLVMGLLPQQTYAVMAEFVCESLRSNPIQVVFYSLVNLKGSAISLCIGALVYLLFVRFPLTDRQTGAYRQIRGPIDLEDNIYRPALRGISFLGAMMGRFFYSLTGWITAFLLWTLRVGNTRRRDPSEDRQFGRYGHRPAEPDTIRQTLQFELLLFGIGVVTMLFYLLINL